MRSHAISVIINIVKGEDVHVASFAPDCLERAGFTAYLHTLFSAEQIALAQKTIEETRPHVRNVLVQAQRYHAFQFEAACQAVEKVMAEALTNAGALIGVAKLKDRDEVTFLHSLAVSALMITSAGTLVWRRK